MRNLIIIFSLIFILFFVANPVSASNFVAENSAELSADEPKKIDYRVQKLRTYLERLSSPLSESAEYFIESADKNNLDWRFVPAISGVESTFGKRIPQNSYNAYGWANGKYKFESWEDSIQTVSVSLREKYIYKGAITIDQIARRYAPPSDSWAWKVKFFMNEIDKTPLSFTL